jgi:hypothetical protein
MALPSPTLRATPAMKDLPVQQRAAQDFRGVRKSPDELIARFHGFFSFHLDA